MPHKHTRRDRNAADSDLPPSAVAKPLPTGKNAQSIFSNDEKRKKKTERAAAAVKDGYKYDDTPKAFARLLQRSQPRAASGLDNGEPKPSGKKRKRGDAQDAKPKPNPKPKQDPRAAPVDVPKIMPGEKLRDFNARVDQSMPVIGLARKGNKGPGPRENRQTKTEKRLHKMYDEWRTEEQRRKDKADEEQELREEEEEERNAEYGENSAVPVEGGGNKRARMIGEAKDDGDPWAVLNATRDKPKGLHDVALAPPAFTVVPKEKFKVKNGARVNVADVPNAAGSLKRREELGAERQNIIEQYRALMGRRGEGA